MTWHLISINPSAKTAVVRFPFFVGRQPLSPNNSFCIPNPTVSRKQFSLSIRLRSLIYKNLSTVSPAVVNGIVVKNDAADFESTSADSLISTPSLDHF